MTLSTNKELIESFIEDIFNKHDNSATEKYFAKYFTTGSVDFKQFLSALFKASPSMQTKIEHIIAENDLVVVFLNGSGTHTEEFRGKSPTNKRVNIRSADLYKIENEKIVEHRDVVDQLNLLHQTGTTLT
jgi:predicted ester cyclase